LGLLLGKHQDRLLLAALSGPSTELSLILVGKSNVERNAWHAIAGREVTGFEVAEDIPSDQTSSRHESDKEASRGDTSP
jgi:hypothetical protein